MAKADGTPSMPACVGMLSGMLLLALAGTLVIMTPSSSSFLQDRRLQVGTVGYVVPLTTPPSSLDSSDSSSSSDSSLEPFKSFEDSSGGSSKSSGAGLEALGSLWTFLGGTTAGQLIMMLIFAFVYKSKAVDPVVQKRGTLKEKMQRQDASGHDDFENGIFECMEDRWVCIHGCFCPLVRMAHTNEVAGVMGFWESAVCWACCAFWSVNIGPCCLLVYWRMKLKEAMGLEDHMLNDFFITLCCPWLSICQQGTAVDTAMGYEVTGCCNLQFDHDHQNARDGQPLK